MPSTEEAIIYLNSRIALFRAIAIFRIFDISRYFLTLSGKNNIANIDDFKIINADKIIILFYHFIIKFGNFRIGMANHQNLSDEDATKEVELVIKSNLKSSITYTILVESFSTLHSLHVSLYFVTLMDDYQDKIKFLKYAAQLSSENLFMEKTSLLISESDVVHYGNLYGKILLMLQNPSYFDSLNLKYYKTLKKLKQPYEYFRNNKLWQIRIMILLTYLFIFCVYADLDLLNKISAFKNAKKELPSYNLRNFTIIMETLESRAKLLIDTPY